jgi:site-specific recombinase XerD
MRLAPVTSLATVRRSASAQELEDFEQELVDQYALARAAAGSVDTHVAAERAMVFEFLRYLRRPVWTTTPQDGDRFLAHQRKELGRARNTVEGKAKALGRFFEFLIARYQGEIHALTGYVVTQPIDEFNRPRKADYDALVRIPPSEDEVAVLFSRWQKALPEARKFLPAARDYLAASLWRRVGLRIGETVKLDIRDWRPDLGAHGKLHVRYGKGSMGRGPKPRLVPGINSVDALLDWWLTDVRHQFGDDYLDPDAPLLPSERRDRHTEGCRRVGDDALRAGLAQAVASWLPTWSGRLCPHVLRHFAASSLYAHGMDLKAIQELCGHDWIATTSLYLHTHDEHIEAAWESANARVANRLLTDEG